MLEKNKTNIDIGKRQRDFTNSKLKFDSKVDKNLEQTSCLISKRNVIQLNMTVATTFSDTYQNRSQNQKRKFTSY